MFQDYALFPHLSVAENVAFGLKMQNLAATETKQRVAAVLGMVKLQAFERRRVTELSGGEQQRVALARALAPRPRLLMFDEPLGALDRALRDRLLGELRGILHQTRVPAIYVTHDQEEAFTIADRIILLHEGEIVQQGAPEEVYARPGSAWVARFLGLGNVLVGRRVKVEGQRSRDVTRHSILDTNSSNIGYQISQIETPFGVWEISCKTGAGDGSSVTLLVRPGAVKAGEGGNRVSGRVADVIFEKDRFKIVLESGFYFYAEKSIEVGADVSLRVEAECLP
jgi:ABC-type Fe3+/spermidine/putrescine transport system ATPase subunit